MTNRATGRTTATAMLALLLTLVSVGPVPGGTGTQEQPATPPPDQRPAGEVYKNIQVFKEMPKARFDRLMEVLNVVLGVECQHCHVGEQWEREDVDAKETARYMFRMVGAIRQEHFEGKSGPACWTCHRGSTEPQALPTQEFLTTAKAATVPDPSPFVPSDRPAAEVYMNIQVLKQVPARNLEPIMRNFTVWLGVECSFCHTEGDWMNDSNEHKQMARKMIQMRSAINEKFFDREPRIGCWTCHRGHEEPEINPPLPAKR